MKKICLMAIVLFLCISCTNDNLKKVKHEVNSLDSFADIDAFSNNSTTSYSARKEDGKYYFKFKSDLYLYEIDKSTVYKNGEEIETNYYSSLKDFSMSIINKEDNYTSYLSLSTFYQFVRETINDAKKIRKKVFSNKTIYSYTVDVHKLYEYSEIVSTLECSFQTKIQNSDKVDVAVYFKDGKLTPKMEIDIENSSSVHYDILICYSEFSV